MNFNPRRAVREAKKLRLALDGPAGSGKTMTALKIARGLAGPNGRIVVMDTERGSSSMYADDPDHADIGEFDIEDQFTSFPPSIYVDFIQFCEQKGYDVCVLDSLTHAWAGTDGALEQVDTIAAKSKSHNSFSAWREVTPEHNRLVDTMLRSSMHIIATLRVKTEWVQDKDANGKTVIQKIGMKTIQRDGLEYEFDVVGDIDLNHSLLVSKSRIGFLADKKILRPGVSLGREIGDWLASGKGAEPRPSLADNPDVARQLSELGVTADERQRLIEWGDSKRMDAEQFMTAVFNRFEQKRKEAEKAAAEKAANEKAAISTQQASTQPTSQTPAPQAPAKRDFNF